jgi:hypothetical protein
LDLPKEDGQEKVKIHDTSFKSDDCETPESTLKPEAELEDKPKPVETVQPKIVRSTGPRALRRRHGRKYTKNNLQRKSSFNGHW